MSDSETAITANTKSSQAYHIWITALLSSYEKNIIHGLVNKGYIVSAADYKGTISSTFEGAAASIIGIKVEKSEIKRDILMEEVREILSSMKAKFYSIVISEFTKNCTWLPTNISFPKETTENPKNIDKNSN